MEKAELKSTFHRQERRERYLAMLSHDLKSALTGVIGGLRQIEPRNISDADLKHRDGALASAMEATRLLDGILDIEAIETGKFELNLEATNLESFVAEIHRRWTARAEWKDIVLKIYMDAGLPEEVSLDRGRLSRVLGNLVDNAIKHTEAGKVELSVSVHGEGSLEFCVSDDGPGFSEQALDNLFEFRGRPLDAKKPGSGLGLYISQSLVTQMGGEIKVSNRQGGGAEAQVIVKTNKFAAKIRTETESASVSVFPSTKLPDLSKLHILLAEDNMTNQMVVTQMLDAMGARFEVASDGVEALAKLEANDYDVLLLDIEMPRLSGLDVIRAVRARKDGKQSQTIIALTAYAMREHRERIASAGADGLIAKPILGIEDFGIDILNTYRKATATFSGDTDGALPEEAVKPNLIDSAIYDALESSIGSDVMAELLSKVMVDLTSVREGISNGLEHSDSKAISSASHILISVAGAIGAIPTQYEAQALNKSAHHGDWTIIRLHAASCLAKIEELLRFTQTRIHR